MACNKLDDRRFSRRIRKATENIPSSVQDGLVWRGRRGGEHGLIVVRVVVAVFGVAEGVVLVAVHGGDVGGRGTEGHEREEKRGGVRVRRRACHAIVGQRASARHRGDSLDLSLGTHAKYGKVSAPLTSHPRLNHVDTQAHHPPSPPTCSTTTTMSNTILLCVSLFSSRMDAGSRDI